MIHLRCFLQADALEADLKAAQEAAGAAAQKKADMVDAAKVRAGQHLPWRAKYVFVFRQHTDWCVIATYGNDCGKHPFTAF